MLFNSLGFLLFFPITVLLYWILPSRFRNIMLLIASYYFYMNWEPIYALLIFLSTITTYFCAIKISESKQTDRRAKLWLTACLVLNFSILFLFKYFNFITSSVHDALGSLGIAMEVPTFTLLLPVGISFYTFQAIGYILDVYRGNLREERNLMTYALFVSFFPQLVAGPIERACNLLPQFHVRHTFDAEKFRHGLYLMTWGYFMKLCIADTVAPYVNAVYNNVDNHTGTSLWLATFFFTLQIFCDFAGYTSIAIGVAKCMNFELMQNFRQPYLAKNIQDFWRRWHISLTTWFTDYLYIPMGGSRCSKLKHHRNIITTFLVSGLWHGANWTFVFWGGYHGLLQVGHSIFSKTLGNTYTKLERTVFFRLFGTVTTFLLVMLGWVFFRANSLSDAFLIYKKMFTNHGPLYNGDGKPAIILPLLLIVFLMCYELSKECRWADVSTPPPFKRSLFITSLLIIIILLCAQFEAGAFIYFQF